MINVEERLFMGKKIIDIWGKPETVLSIMDDVLAMDGFHLIQLHTFQVMPFYHAFIEYVPSKKKWYRRIFSNDKGKTEDNPIFERVQKEGKEVGSQQNLNENSEAIGKRLRRMQIL